MGGAVIGSGSYFNHLMPYRRDFAGVLSPNMTHASVPEDERIRSGLQPGGMRLLLGLQDWQDIIADLEDALEVV
jgi:cystathionine beta-lyase/cystathionine gamma-synthase